MAQTTTEIVDEWEAAWRPMEYSICGGPSYGNDGFVIWRQTETCRRLVDRRPKPEVLIDSMTAQELSYQKVGEIGHLVATTRYPYNGCYVDYRQHRYPGLPFDAFSPVNPEWATKLRNRIKSDAVNLAETIGEYRESVRFLSDGAQVLKKAASAARNVVRDRKLRRSGVKIPRGRLYRVNSYKGMVADAIGMDLAVKFGIKPMVGLLIDSLEACKRAESEGIVKRYRTLQTATSDGRGSFDGINYHWTCRKSLRVTAIVRYKPYQSVWTSGNPLESIWAGTHLSFMVDWFYNVGSYLSALDALDSVVSLRGTISTTDAWIMKGESSSWGQAVRLPKLTYRAHKRDLLTGIPLPELPTWKPSVSWGKLQSAMEILVSLRLNKHRR